jgi:hypothetical protein
VWERYNRFDGDLPTEATGRHQSTPRDTLGWYGEDEIDIVGLAPNDDRILFAECKWTSDPVDRTLIADLQAKAENVRWGPETRDERFALFSKSGFVAGLEDQLDETWSLFGLPEFDDLLSPS